MSRNKDTKYVQFPLFLWRKLLTGDRKKMADEMLFYGICNRANSLFTNDFISDEDIASLLLYDFFNKKENLSSSLSQKLNTFAEEGRLEYELENNGFCGYKDFYPVTEIEELLIIFSEDLEFYEDARWHSSIARAAFSSNIINLKPDRAYDDYVRINRMIPENEPMPMIGVNTIFELRDKSFSNFELETIAGYIGVKSIIGQKPYVVTNFDHIRARMFGYSTINQLSNDNLKSPEIKALIEKYSKRYWMERLISELEYKWHLRCYCNHSRGIYITDKLSIKELALIAEKNKRKNKENRRQFLKKEAREEALKCL